MTALEAPPELPAKIFIGNNLLLELYKACGAGPRSRPAVLLRQQLCAAAGVSNTQLGHWLNNRAQPNLGETVALAQVLGVSLDALCNLTDRAQ